VVLGHTPSIKKESGKASNNNGKKEKGMVESYQVQYEARIAGDKLVRQSIKSRTQKIGVLGGWASKFRAQEGASVQQLGRRRSPSVPRCPASRVRTAYSMYSNALGQGIEGSWGRDSSPFPGMGGAFNAMNLNLWHYGGNNPIKFLDPDGRYIIINDVSGRYGSAHEYQARHPMPYGNLGTPRSVVSPYGQLLWFPIDKVTLPGNLNNILKVANQYNTDRSSQTSASITSTTRKLESGNYAITITVETYIKTDDGTILVNKDSGVLAYAGGTEIGVLRQSNPERPSPRDVIKIVNDAINNVNGTSPRTNNNVRYNYEE